MISVYFGYDHEAIIRPDEYFRWDYEDEWFDDEIVKQMVKDIDKSEVLSAYCIQSPVLGQIAPEYLSGGVKTCILLYKRDDFMPDLINCGENCCYWLARIAEMRDIKVTMSGYDLTFRNIGIDIKGICENDNQPINNCEDWVLKMCDYAGEPENER